MKVKRIIERRGEGGYQCAEGKGERWFEERRKLSLLEC